MLAAIDKEELIGKLQREILSMQGLRDIGSPRIHLGLEKLEQAFPGKSFPVGAVHEFLSHAPSEAAATQGFITGLLHKLMHANTYCLWVSVRRNIYPPALKRFGIDPHRILFVDAATNTEALWVMEEGLKCNSLAAVIGEVPELSFTESRRLQLAVESSRVTGLIHRSYPRNENTVACVSRWHIRPVASKTEEGLPGPGFPRWEVTLSRIRNGRPGTWHIEWTGDGFRQVLPETTAWADDTGISENFNLEKPVLYG